MTMKRATFVKNGAAAAALGLLPRAALAQTFNNPYQQKLTVAVNVPLSGDSQKAGLQVEWGAQAALDELNRTSGEFGTAFAVRTFDDMDALAQAIVNVQEAAADETILATIAGFDGSLITATLDAYQNAQMPVIVAGSTADSITQRGYRMVWRLPTKDSVEGQLAAQFALARAKPKQPIAVTQDGDYGPDVGQGFVNAARSGHTDALLYAFPYEKPHYGAAAAALMTKKPDFIYLCGTTNDMGPLIPALRSAGYSGAFGASQGFFNEDALKSYAASFTGGFVSTSLAPLDLAPDIAMIYNDFRARYPVTALSAFGYAAAQIVMTAARRSGARNRLATMAALQTPATYTTMAGDFRFGPTGDPDDPIVYFYTVSGGEFKYAAPSHPTPFVL
jgi:branched-chain amino acid transport system substrate-binding protein